MSSINDSKRLNDEELEAVAGGVTPPTMDPMLLTAMGHGFPGLTINPPATDTHTAAPPPTIDPSTVAGLMHSTVSAAVAGGGAYTMDTHTPAPMDSGSPTITGQTHTTVSGSTLFGGSSLAAPEVQVSSVPVLSETVTLSGHLNVFVPPPPPPTIEVMTFPSSEGQFTRITPIVVGVQEGGEPNLGGALGTAFKP